MCGASHCLGVIRCMLNCIGKLAVVCASVRERIAFKRVRCMFPPRVRQNAYVMAQEHVQLQARVASRVRAPRKAHYT